MGAYTSDFYREYQGIRNESNITKTVTIRTVRQGGTAPNKPMAAGGPVFGGESYTVGEQRRELYVPYIGKPSIIGQTRNERFIAPADGYILPRVPEYRHQGGPMYPNRQNIVKNDEHVIFTGKGGGGQVTPTNQMSLPLVGGGELAMVVIHAMVEREHLQYLERIANPPVPAHQNRS